MTRSTPEPAPEPDAPLPPAAESVWLRLTGAPAAGRSGDAGRPLERKDAGWLALLQAEGAVPRTRLAAWLWPEASEKAAAGNLRQRIFRLRRAFGHALVQAGERVVLLPGVVADLDDAHGELLAGCDYGDCPEMAHWLQQQRERRRAQRLDRHAAAAAQHEAAGALVAALAEVQAMLQLEPLSEHAGRWLMRLHYLRGDRAAALAAFERLEQRLKDELGTPPGAETLALLATVERAVPPGPVPGPRGVPASLRRPPRLVGRDDELAALQRTWAAERVFILVGEAGMGKTRLLAELAGRRGARCLHVAARPGDAGVPFALLSRLLRLLLERCGAPADESTRRGLARVLPELLDAGDGAALGGDGQRLQLQRAAETLLRRAAAAGSDELLLDDLHFADAASLELLQAVVPAEPPLPLRWGLARRPGEGGAALHEALLEAQRLHEQPLQPLDEAAMRQLVDSLGVPGLDAAALAGPLVRHTGGNPLFALETLKDHVLAGVPDGGLPQPASVGALIERRLKTLSAPALALARVAAIAGVDFGIELAEAVLQQPALALVDAWAELQAAQVLAGEAFAHDLVADATLRGVPEAIARHVHAAVAGWLQRRGGEPARRAEHWEAAGHPVEAATAFEQAAERARGAGRLVDALALRRRAAAAWQAAGDRAARWRCQAQGVEACLFVEGVGAAMALAQALADEAGDERERIAGAEALGLVHLMAGRFADCDAVVTPALALAERLGQPALALDALRQWSLARSQLGHAPEAIDRLRQAAALYDSAGTLRQRYEHRSSLAYALNEAGRITACKAALREAIALAREAGDLAEVASSLSNLAIAESASGHVGDGLALARDVGALHHQLGVDSGPHALVHGMNIGVLATQVGDYNLALQWLETAPERLAPLGPMWRSNAENHLAVLWLALGQWHRAERLLHNDGGAATIAVRARRDMLLARLARWRGQPDPVHRAALERDAAELAKNTRARSMFGLQLELSHWLPPDEALALVREAGREADAAGQQGFVLHAAMRELALLWPRVVPGGPGAVDVAARVAVLQQQLDGHDAHLVPSDAYRPEPWVLSATVHAAAGRTEAARALAARARAWIDACAAERLPAGLRRVYLDTHPVHVALRALEASGTGS